MNKTELTMKLAKRTGLTQAQAAKAVDAVFNPTEGLIAEELAGGEDKQVVIPGFGSFMVRARQARQGRNPATGKAISIPERQLPAFRPGKTLREKIGD